MIKVCVKTFDFYVVHNILEHVDREKKKNTNKEIKQSKAEYKETNLALGCNLYKKIYKSRSGNNKENERER